jgi:hypothetical protein
VLVASAKTASFDLNNQAMFKMSIDIDYNMRPRLGRDDMNVGLNIAICTMECYKTNGVDLNTPFWSEARRAKQLTEKYIKNPGLNNNVSAAITNSVDKSHFEGLTNGLLSDINISNIGKYAFPLEHLGCDCDLRIGDFHLYNAINSLVGNALVLFVSSTDTINLSLMTKFDLEESKAFLKHPSQVLNGMSEIASDTSLKAVIISLQ